LGVAAVAAVAVVAVAAAVAVAVAAAVAVAVAAVVAVAAAVALHLDHGTSPSFFWRATLGVDQGRSVQRTRRCLQRD
jgi:fructose/tagatose bisphosphate aldolase